MKNDTPKCLRPDCTRKARARGLCAVCYQSAQRMVMHKQTTWAKLEAAKKVLPRRTRAGHGICADWLLS